MRCVHCGSEHEATTVGFKAVCETCGRYLHSCVQCRLYSETRHCLSSTTEAVRDVERANFCEEFQPRDVRNSEDGRISDDRARRSFDDLFGT